jgi:RNA polymerase subunit RPABC4/transcription elongation factor Spt4
MVMDDLSKPYGGSYSGRKTLTVKQQQELTPNKSNCCTNCGDVLDLTDTRNGNKNGKEREFCRYGGRPECGECARFFPKGTKSCPDCLIEVKTKLKCEDCNRIMKNDNTAIFNIQSREQVCNKCEEPFDIIKRCSKCKEVIDSEQCPKCTVELRIPSCVKEYSMYIAKLNQVRNELMADPKERLNMNIIFEIMMNKPVSISQGSTKRQIMENLREIEVKD